MRDIDKELDKLSMLIDSARVLAEKIEDENPLLDVYEICDDLSRPFVSEIDDV